MSPLLKFIKQKNNIIYLKVKIFKGWILFVLLYKGIHIKIVQCKIFKEIKNKPIPNFFLDIIKWIFDMITKTLASQNCLLLDVQKSFSSCVFKQKIKACNLRFLPQKLYKEV